MSEEQKNQVETIAAEMNKLKPELREGALMYLQVWPRAQSSWRARKTSGRRREHGN